MDFKVQVKLKNSYWREVHVQSGETSVVFGSLVFILPHKKTNRTSIEWHSVKCQAIMVLMVAYKLWAGSQSHCWNCEHCTIRRSDATKVVMQNYSVLLVNSVFE